MSKPLDDTERNLLEATQKELRAMRAEISALKERGAWVRVDSGELPDEGDDIWFWVIGHCGPTLGYYGDDEKPFWPDDGGVEDCYAMDEVSHWMPATKPTPPEAT